MTSEQLAKYRNEFEQQYKLYTWKMLVPCVPFPFQGTAVAGNEEAALKKIIFQAKTCKLKAWGPALEVEKLNYQAGHSI